MATVQLFMSGTFESGTNCNPSHQLTRNIEGVDGLRVPFHYPYESQWNCDSLTQSIYLDDSLQNINSFSRECVSSTPAVDSLLYCVTVPAHEVYLLWFSHDDCSIFTAVLPITTGQCNEVVLSVVPEWVGGLSFKQCGNPDYSFKVGECMSDGLGQEYYFEALSATASPIGDIQISPSSAPDSSATPSKMPTHSPTTIPSLAPTVKAAEHHPCSVVLDYAYMILIIQPESLVPEWSMKIAEKILSKSKYKAFSIWSEVTKLAEVSCIINNINWEPITELRIQLSKMDGDDCVETLAQDVIDHPVVVDKVKAEMTRAKSVCLGEKGRLLEMVVFNIKIDDGTEALANINITQQYCNSNPIVCEDIVNDAAVNQVSSFALLLMLCILICLI